VIYPLFSRNNRENGHETGSLRTASRAKIGFSVECVGEGAATVGDCR
jgi:hypothetical protein